MAATLKWNKGRQRIWVVEMLNDEYAMSPPRWEPTVGVGLSRDHARAECDRWREDNPDDKFRVREYLQR